MTEKPVKNAVVLTGVGRDRVGIVAELTQALFELGCNLLDSSMTLLRGEFAIILMAELPSQVSVDKLTASVNRLEEQLGMHLHVRLMDEDELAESPQAENAFIVSVYGADKPGIVARITRAIADAHMNITDVQTKSTGVGNDRVFVMVLEITANDAFTAKSIERTLRNIGVELSVDIALQPLETAEL